MPHAQPTQEELRSNIADLKRELPALVESVEMASTRLSRVLVGLHMTHARLEELNVERPIPTAVSDFLTAVREIQIVVERLSSNAGGIEGVEGAVREMCIGAGDLKAQALAELEQALLK